MHSVNKIIYWVEKWDNHDKYKRVRHYWNYACNLFAYFRKSEIIPHPKSPFNIHGCQILDTTCWVPYHGECYLITNECIVKEMIICKVNTNNTTIIGILKWIHYWFWCSCLNLQLLYLLYFSSTTTKNIYVLFVIVHTAIIFSVI